MSSEKKPLEKVIELIENKSKKIKVAALKKVINNQI